MSKFRLPTAGDKAVVFGRNGSGKTVFLTWLLSHASIEDRPWIIVDYKNDEYLRNLPRVQRIKLGELPKHPGIYIVNPTVRDEDAVDQLMHRIIERGNTGLFTDEGASLPQREPKYIGLKGVLAMGRSKRTPVLFATQRPAWLNQSLLSEGDFYAAFHLQNEKDRDRAALFIPGGIEPRLDDYHARWYDVRQDAHFIIRPVREDETMQRLDERLRPRQRLR